ncbi:AAA family ATPase, partial [Francisella tularensis]|uniref:AAA family ATPase n=1 Tax=Francisella tularensis TaxID=263 RepID=UPI002381C9BD
GVSGKTTTAIKIACGLQEIGYRVAIIDMDKDKPAAYMWMTKNNQESNFVYSVDETNVREKVIELKHGLDFIDIDTPPN